MDEFHFYADPDRGWAWQVPLLELPQAQFVLMSATLGDVRLLRRGPDPPHRPADGASSTSAERPVPLHFRYVLDAAARDDRASCSSTRQAPVYVVHFTQAAAVERAQALIASTSAAARSGTRSPTLIGGFRFTAGFGKTLSRLVRHGIGVHHAGMLPTLPAAGRDPRPGRAAQGHLRHGHPRRRHQRADPHGAVHRPDEVRRRAHPRSSRPASSTRSPGRAGRAGFDTAGTVVVQAPDHEIENARLLAKAGDDPKKRRKIVRKKAPEGFVTWGEPTFERLRGRRARAADQPASRSRTRCCSTSIARPGDAVRRDATRCSPTTTSRASRQRRHIRRAIAIYRGAARRRRRRAARRARRRTAARVRLTVDLQPTSRSTSRSRRSRSPRSSCSTARRRTYALDVVSVIESTLDDPRQVLSAQQNKARGEAVAAMKAEGIEYDERMELLEEVTWPKPLAELLDRRVRDLPARPAVGRDFELSPKSVVRDMFERAMTFAEYVGVLPARPLRGPRAALPRRRLPGAAPDRARRGQDRGADDIIEWLGELVRQVDSSLLDEWERAAPTRASDAARTRRRRADRPPAGVTAQRPRVPGARAQRAVPPRGAGRAAPVGPLGELDAEAGWDAERWREALEPYFAEHDEIGTGPDARGRGAVCRSSSEPRRWPSGRCSTTPRATTTGRIGAEVDLAPRTRRAPRSCASRRWCGSAACRTTASTGHQLGTAGPVRVRAPRFATRRRRGRLTIRERQRIDVA